MNCPLKEQDKGENRSVRVNSLDNIMSNIDQPVYK